MLLAELEVRHSRAVAPTRRVAVGRHWLPTDPAPGFGGVLLAGVVAAHVDAVPGDLWAELVRLVDDLEEGRRVSQPRLRHRFQVDVIGLDRSRHRLVGRDLDGARFEIDDHARPIPQLLGALYAARGLHPTVRPAVFNGIRRALTWDGALDRSFIGDLVSGDGLRSAWLRFPTDERWARRILGFEAEREPTRNEVQTRFRRLLREAHPDHGGEHTGAAERILELSEARRILLA